MKTNIMNKTHETLTATREFLTDYLKKKDKSTGNIYLSFYISEDHLKNTLSREVRIRKILREVALTLKSQLKPKMANHFLDKLKEIDVAEIVRDNKTSIGFYVSEDFSGFFCIPFPVVENVVIAQSLHLKPILSWILAEDQFYLITLSSKLCRLLKGNSFSLTEVCSASLSGHDLEKNKKLANKNIKLKILQQAEEVFHQHLKNDMYPIIVGGVDELHDLYRSINRDPDVMKDRIVGNLNRSNFDDLHNDCLDILKTKRAMKDNETLCNYTEMKPYGKVIEDLNQISIAAIQGRIKNLLVSSDRFLWGHVDKTTGEITNHINKNLAIPEDDILDDLAEIVIAHGGNIILLKQSDMPSDNEAIAFLK